jgi:hypothetical protein
MTKQVTVLVFLICAGLMSRSEERDSPQSATVHAEMHNVLYHLSDSISVHIVQLQGKLLPTNKERLPIFDDANSFTLEIDSAEISITADTLANVLNQYVFAAPDAPLKGIHISVQGEKLKIRGRLRSKGNVPFESEGTLSPTSQGEIRVHTEKLKAAHIPVKGLMDVLGETVSKLIDTRKVRGLRADQDDLILIPSELFPPPHIQGRLTSIQVRDNEILQLYGTNFQPSLKLAGNYMAYRGAQLRFGKLTMSDTDLILIDLDPQDPFDFYLDHYRDQLVAGYTKITPSFGLRTYFRDYNKLIRKRKPRTGR